MRELALSLCGAAFLVGCTSLHEPLEEKKPTESLRMSGDIEKVGRCVVHDLHERDPSGHYEFYLEDAEGVLEGNGEWEVVFRQETPTGFRAAIKTDLTNAGAPKRPAGLSFLIARCAGQA